MKKKRRVKKKETKNSPDYGYDDRAHFANFLSFFKETKSR